VGLFVAAATLATGVTEAAQRASTIIPAREGRLLLVVNPDSNSVSLVET
jgi:hypothetical protein